MTSLETREWETSRRSPLSEVKKHETTAVMKSKVTVVFDSFFATNCVCSLFPRLLQVSPPSGTFQRDLNTHELV